MFKRIVNIFLGTICLVSCSGHSHTFDTTWSYDNEYHWHNATCEHTEEVSDKAKHTFDDDGVCTVCHFDSINHEVSSDEWNATFGPNTVYGLGENYIFNMLTGPKDNQIQISHVVDGNKMKEEESSYYLFENDILYHFNQMGSHWNKSVSEDSPKDIIGTYTFMIGSYDSYQYNPSIKGYYCQSKTIEGGTIEDIVVKFMNKKLTGWSATMKNGDDVGYVNVNIKYGGQTVNLPTLSKAKLMGSFDGWKQGIDMQPIDDSPSQYVVNSVHLNAGTKIKVKIDDESINKWITDSDTAVGRNIVVIDSESNGEVLVEGDFNIIFESNPESENYGVKILVERIASPYYVYISHKKQDGSLVYSALETNFNQVVLNNDEKYVEYKCPGCETYPEYNYSIIVIDNSSTTPTTIPVDLLPGGESNNFVKDGDSFTYKGDAHHVDFYIRFPLNGGKGSIFVEKID